MSLHLPQVPKILLWGLNMDIHGGKLEINWATVELSKILTFIVRKRFLPVFPWRELASFRPLSSVWKNMRTISSTPLVSTCVKALKDMELHSHVHKVAGCSQLFPKELCQCWSVVYCVGYILSEHHQHVSSHLPTFTSYI